VVAGEPRQQVRGPQAERESLSGIGRGRIIADQCKRRRAGRQAGICVRGAAETASRATAERQETAGNGEQVAAPKTCSRALSQRCARQERQAVVAGAGKSPAVEAARQLRYRRIRQAGNGMQAETI